MPANQFYSGWIYYAQGLKAKLVNLGNRCVSALAEEEVRLHREDVLKQIDHKTSSEGSRIDRESSF